MNPNIIPVLKRKNLKFKQVSNLTPARSGLLQAATLKSRGPNSA